MIWTETAPRKEPVGPLHSYRDRPATKIGARRANVKLWVMEPRLRRLPQQEATDGAGLTIIVVYAQPADFFVTAISECIPQGNAIDFEVKKAKWRRRFAIAVRSSVVAPSERQR